VQLLDRKGIDTLAKYLKTYKIPHSIARNKLFDKENTEFAYDNILSFNYSLTVIQVIDERLSLLEKYW